MKGLYFGIIVMIVLASGCATAPPLSKDEWNAITTRHYSNISQDQALKAAETIFRLSDPSDFEFTYKDRTLKASRTWGHYFIVWANMGFDYWEFSAEPKGDGVIAKAWLELVFAGGGISGNRVPPKPDDARAIFNLFWSRMDYLLGLTDEWISCDAAGRFLPTGKVSEMIAPLCDDLTVRDDKPTPEMRVVAGK